MEGKDGLPHLEQLLGRRGAALASTTEGGLQIVYAAQRRNVSGVEQDARLARLRESLANLAEVRGELGGAWVHGLDDERVDRFLAMARHALPGLGGTACRAEPARNLRPFEAFEGLLRNLEAHAAELSGDPGFRSQGRGSEYKRDE